MKKFLLIICVILPLIAAIILRFYSLGSLPPGTNLDEVNIGVEALSIIQTGRDSWGELMPRAFRAFGEYKAPGLIYSVAGILKVIPLSPLATRLPSALSGLFSAFAIYLIIGKLLPKYSVLARLVAITFFILSPWAFGISRQFYEANAGLPFMLFGLYFLLKDQNKYSLIFGGIFLGLGGYFYMSFRYLAVLFALAYGLMAQESLKQKIKKTGILLLIIVIIGIGWSIDYLSQKSLRRLSQYNNYTTFGNSLTVDENRQYCYLVSGKNLKFTKLCYVFWNKPIVQINRLANTYLTSTSPTNLFLDANNTYTIPKNYGMYIWTLFPFYLLGLFSLYKSWIGKNENQKLRLFSLWAIISPIPQAFSTEISIHRNVVFLALVFVIVALGYNNFYISVLNKIKYQTIFQLFLIIFTSFITFQYILNYFTVFTHSEDIMWNADKTEIWNFIGDYDLSEYKVVDTKYLGPMDAAFYQLISPLSIQQGIRQTPNSEGWSHLVSAGNVYVGDVSIMRKMLCDKYETKDDIKTLIITDPQTTYGGFATFSSKSFTGIHSLHHVYDLDKLYDELQAQTPNYFEGCK